MDGKEISIDFNNSFRFDVEIKEDCKWGTPPTKEEILKDVEEGFRLIREGNFKKCHFWKN